ncbi:unnamed protein product [Lymnaea stagnalis]|uniref:SWIM-type domain-containing protein n=1 Tax=Lymnaea stagnalis TaxID=6523 RepID=A0AAV2IEF6_LYMST
MDIGKEYSSWDTFQNALEQYSKENKVVYIVGTCKPVETANRNDSLQYKFPPKFKYCFARMLCKHYGNYSSRSVGHRPHQRTCKTGCTSSILVSVNKKRTALVIKEANLQHTHEVSEIIFSKYPQNRRLQGEERRMASVLLRAGVPLSRVQEFISNSCSKAPTIKDLKNIKTSMKGSLPEKEGHEFEFLTDLDLLMAEDMESVVEIINFDLVPGAVYFQTSDMFERIKTLQGGQLQIVTLHINDGKMSLVSVVGVDKDLNSQTLAFCIIIVGAEAAFQYFVEAFVKNNQSFCDTVTGVVLDWCKDSADFLQQLIPQAAIAWSRSYILESFTEELKCSKDIQKMLTLYKELMNASSEKVYEDRLKDVLESKSATESKEFLKKWDSCKEFWVQYVISSSEGLQHQQSAVEMDYINSLRAFVQPSMGLSELIKALLKLDRNEEPDPEEEKKEQLCSDPDPSCDLYRHLCFPQASLAIINQIVIALGSMYNIKIQTDMIFINRVDNEEEFILDNSGSKCTCPYFMETDLPCQHIFAWLKFSNKPLYNETLVPIRWQVFGKSITLDALAESLNQGQVPSSFHHDERLKELQGVLKDTLSICCSHSYQQMGQDLVLLKQILAVMSNCSSNKAKVVMDKEEDKQNNVAAAQLETVTPLPRRRGRPSKKDKLLQQEQNGQPAHPKMPTPPAGSRHNLRANIKHKFVTREVHYDANNSDDPVSKKMKDFITENDSENIISTIPSIDGTELLRTIVPKTDTANTSIVQFAKLGSDQKPHMDTGDAKFSSLEGKENNVSITKSVRGHAFSRLKGARNLSVYKQKLYDGYHVSTPRRGRRPSALKLVDRRSRSDEESSGDDDDDNEENEDSNHPDGAEADEAKEENRTQDLQFYLRSISQDTLNELMQAVSLLDLPEEKALGDKEGSPTSSEYPAAVLVRMCKNTEMMESIVDHIKQNCFSYDKFIYQVSACIIYRSYQTGVAISDLLQTVSYWPNHLPEFPAARPLDGELTLAEGQVLRLGGYKLQQADMDTLKTGEELSVKVLHAYLEVLAQKHSGKMFLIPYDVVHSWRSGNYIDRVFKKVHLKTFEYLVLPIHCGAEFTESERQSSDIPEPCWMALVADVKKRTVAIMNPKTDDKYAIAANGYMLQWRRYMQIRSVHTGEMLCSWSTHQIECCKIEKDHWSGIHLLMNVEALINNVAPIVMTEAHVRSYLHLIAVALRDTDRETTVLCVGGPECQVLAARDADWLQCENCRTWWHRACADQPASRPIFYCNSCHQRILAVKGNILTVNSQPEEEECFDDGNEDEMEETANKVDDDEMEETANKVDDDEMEETANEVDDDEKSPVLQEGSSIEVDH